MTIGCTVRDMGKVTAFDPTFDFRTDANGRDPDAASPTRAYHKLLWSKPLPSGDSFELNDTEPGAYLCHPSGNTKFLLTSDSAMPTFIRYRRMAHIIHLMPESGAPDLRCLRARVGGTVCYPTLGTVLAVRSSHFLDATRTVSPAPQPAFRAAVLVGMLHVAAEEHQVRTGICGEPERFEP